MHVPVGMPSLQLLPPFPCTHTSGRPSIVLAHACMAYLLPPSVSSEFTTLAVLPYPIVSLHGGPGRRCPSHDFPLRHCMHVTSASYPILSHPHETASHRAVHCALRLRHFLHGARASVLPSSIQALCAISAHIAALDSLTLRFSTGTGQHCGHWCVTKGHRSTRHQRSLPPCPLGRSLAVGTACTPHCHWCPRRGMLLMPASSIAFVSASASVHACSICSMVLFLLSEPLQLTLYFLLFFFLRWLPRVSRCSS